VYDLPPQKSPCPVDVGGMNECMTKPSLSVEQGTLWHFKVHVMSIAVVSNAGSVVCEGARHGTLVQ
jgi:hypothetical protein